MRPATPGPRLFRGLPDLEPKQARVVWSAVDGSSGCWARERSAARSADQQEATASAKGAGATGCVAVGKNLPFPAARLQHHHPGYCACGSVFDLDHLLRHKPADLLHTGP